MGEWKYSATILDLGTKWRLVVCQFTPGDRAPGTHWIGGWMGPITGLDALYERKISCPFGESNPGRPTGCLVAIRTEPTRLPKY
jgi:hypothetical protein